MISSYLNWAVARGRRRPKARSNSVRLPFNGDPLAKGYLYNAYALGILTARAAPETIYGHYTQLFFPTAKATGDSTAKLEFFPPLGIRQYIELGYLEGCVWSWREGHASDRSGLAERLIAILARGRFVRAFVNEFFIPGTAPYLRQDFRHEHLLVGYHAESSTFVGICYLANGEFGWTRTPATLFVEAMRSARGRVAGTYNDNDFVLEIEAKTLPDLPADPATLHDQIRAFLEGEADPLAAIRRLRRLSFAEGPADLKHWPCAQYEGVFGARIYPLLRAWLRRTALERAEFDLRATRTLLEHKVALRHCLRSLVANDELRALAPEEFEPVITAARALHILAFNANRERPVHAVQLAESLSKRIDEIERREREVLGDAIERFAWS